MRARILGTGLLLGLAATALGAPVALAGDTAAADSEPFLAASGAPLVPGQELQISGYCPDPTPGPLTSDVLTGIHILHDPESGPPNLLADGVVTEGTAPGEYAATMDCAGHQLRVTFTVIEPAEPTHDLPADYLLITPESARPGQQVSAQVSCDRTDETLLTSPVLRTATMAPDPEGHQPWALHGTTTVLADAAPGEYPVSAQCWNGVVKTAITVLDEVNRDGDRARVVSGGDGDVGGGQVTRVPKGAPETGGGTHHLSLSLLVVGLGLGAAVAAGAIALREVRR